MATGTAADAGVTVQITSNTIGVARADFGILMIPSYTATWSERTRVYESVADVAADFPTTGSEYLAASAAFGQSPHPEQIIIGRMANKPTQQYQIGAVSVVNSQAYSINSLNRGATEANPVTYTSDASATVQEIHNGLVTNLNAIVGKNYTATFAPLVYVSATFTTSSANLVMTAHGLNTGDGPLETSNSGGALPTGLAASTQYWVIKVDANDFQLATSLANALAGIAIVTSGGTGTQTLVQQAGQLSPFLPFLVTGSASGNFFSLEVTNVVLMSIKQTHADPGTAADLDAILSENSSWYTFSTKHNSQALVLVAAAWAQANGRIYFPCVNETAAITTAGGTGGTADTLDNLKTLGYSYVAGCYHPSPAQFMEVAWQGCVLSIDVGQDDWKWKVLAGIPAVNTTATHRTNLRARAANWVQNVFGVNVTMEGTLSSAGFIDNTRGIDAFVDDLSKGIFQVFLNTSAVPFTDAGIALVENAIRASAALYISKGVLSPDSKPIITVPDSADVSSADKALRTLPDVLFSGLLSGRIHKVNVSGVVSV